jgi:RNA polymerase sigma factor (sigma-70 family)
MANPNAHRRNCRDVAQPVWDKVLGGLTDREAQVIRLRFGIGVNAPLSVTEIARMLKITRERVRQIETKVLRRIETAFPPEKP